MGEKLCKKKMTIQEMTQEESYQWWIKNISYMYIINFNQGNKNQNNFKVLSYSSHNGKDQRNN